MGNAYQELRPYLFAIAYRMVSSVSDAEDIVQEAFLRFHRATSEGEVVESPRGYLSAVTTRLAIDTCARRVCAARAMWGSGCRSL